jgi:hypothetical protein
MQASTLGENLGWQGGEAKHGEQRSLGDLLLEELYSSVGEGWEREDDITPLTPRRSAARS